MGSMLHPDAVRHNCNAPSRRYRLNVWDVGGQRTIRSYWRNYYESTDGLIWVVDSADVHRMQDCAQVPWQAG
jgi:GTPase SAR1 family protein